MLVFRLINKDTGNLFITHQNVMMTLSRPFHFSRDFMPLLFFEVTFTAMCLTTFQLFFLNSIKKTVS